PRVHLPIKQYSFTPFPTPSQSSVPGVFPDTDPSSPPGVGAAIIPNFQPSWNVAYEKATSMRPDPLVLCGHDVLFLTLFGFRLLASLSQADGQRHDWYWLGERPMCR
ncbi:hypothetical protein MPER_13725, partial [Moniliophthora perniciosa FA553]